MPCFDRESKMALVKDRAMNSTDAELRRLQYSVSDEYGSSDEPIQSLAAELLALRIATRKRKRKPARVVLPPHNGQMGGDFGGGP